MNYLFRDIKGQGMVFHHYSKVYDLVTKSKKNLQERK